MSRYQAYSSYKYSSAAWLGEVPEHWIVSKFGYLKTVLTDFTANGSFADLAKNVNYKDSPDFARLVRLTDLRKNLKNDDGVWIDEQAYTYLKKSALFGGEFLLANVGAYAGLFYQMPFTDMPASLAPNMFMAKFDNRKVSEHYMSYIGRSYPAYEQLKLHATASSAQPKLNKDDFKSIVFTYPSLSEQTAIANFLDIQTAKIDTLIAKQQRMIELLGEKRSALISHAVTKGLDPNVKMKDSGVEWLGEVPEHWEVASLKYFYTSLDSKRIPLSATERENISGEYPYYGASGIIDYVNDYIFDETTVLVGEDGANLVMRSTPLAFIADEKYWVNNHAHILKFKDGLHNYWTYTINSLDISPFVSGSAQPKLTAENLQSLKMATPTTEKERILIANYLDIQTAKIDTLIAKARQVIELMKERRTALISAAVTGKIDVRGETA